ncbi:hypothetical protein QJQ45_006812 [Haematococcus lacustris]|nr:hypothetical protein QJQ45_006812 [Haematococcus lacustris]
MALPHLFAALGSSDQATRMEVAVDVVYHAELRLPPPENGQQQQQQQQRRMQQQQQQQQQQQKSKGLADAEGIDVDDDEELESSDVTASPLKSTFSATSSPVAAWVQRKQQLIDSKENTHLREQIEQLSACSPRTDAQTEALLMQYEEDIRSLQARVASTEAKVATRDAAIAQLQQLMAQQDSASAQIGVSEKLNGKGDWIACNGGTAAQHHSSEVRGKLMELDSELRSKLAKLEHELEQAHATIAAKDSMNGALQAQLRDVIAGRSVHAGAAEGVLAEQVEALKAALHCAAAELQESQLREVTPQAAMTNPEAGDAKLNQQIAALQKQETDEQRIRQVQELEAELRSRDAELQKLKGSTGSARTLQAQAKEQAIAAVSGQLEALYVSVDKLQAAREGILADLMSIKKDIFNDKVVTQMVRLVRDKEISCVRKLRGETRAGLEAAEKRAQDAAEALEAAKERFEHELRIKDLESEGQVAHFKNKWKAEWEKRKKLHNTVLELRGSIRVLCRVRPLLEKERAGLEEGAPDPVKVLSDEVMRVAGEKADKEFEFDRVFKPTEGQEQVFDEVSSLVTSVLDGYNVSIMAYGQTGSGKTYTMEGLETDPGVNSRALKELFRSGQLPALPAPAQHQRSTSAAPAQHQRSTSAAPAQHQRSTSAAPAQHQRSTSAAPAQHQRSTSAAPAQHQRSTSAAPAQHQRSTSAAPAQHQRSTSAAPAPALAQCAFVLFGCGPGPWRHLWHERQASMVLAVRRLAEERAEDLKYKFSASVLEIYNEQIYDLLAGGRDQDGDKLDVKQAPDGSMYVPGCKVEDVASLTDVAAVMRRGKQNRSTFATNMNEHSSRSHLVLSVQVTATAVAGGSTMRGKLHLIDLAGSERIGRTGAQGDRLKEAQNINKSLSALGDVIQALQQRHSHIPYRNSKLTRLLEDSLGSSSKCLMVVNVSPALENVAETKCSLEFASRARKVELGKARQHVESSATASLAPSPSILGAALGSSRPPVHTTSQSSRSNSGTTPEHSLRSSIAASTGSAQGRGKLGRVTTFGESHGKGVGCVVDGVPPRLPISEEEIQLELDRRKPGQSIITTPRKEEDIAEILSGVADGVTLGSPIAVLVRNKDQRSGDYSEMSVAYRPSHADATYDFKYGIRAVAGGGRSSARETIGRVAAGAIAKKLLKVVGNTEILAYVSDVMDIGSEVDHATFTLADVESNIVRCPDQAAAAKMIDAINAVRTRGESCGGQVTCVVRSCPKGLGSPVFGKLEAELAKAMLSLPATKGFEVGSGFQGARMLGSEHNDEFYIAEDGQPYVDAAQVRTRTNRSGGVQGGLSNGEDIIIKVAFKPTSTIGIKQKTVTREGQETDLRARGRHDPCVVPRAVPMVESMVALVLADQLLQHYAQCELLPRAEGSVGVDSKVLKQFART